MAGDAVGIIGMAHGPGAKMFAMACGAGKRADHLRFVESMLLMAFLARGINGLRGSIIGGGKQFAELEDGGIGGGGGSQPAGRPRLGGMMARGAAGHVAAAVHFGEGFAGMRRGQLARVDEARAKRCEPQRQQQARDCGHHDRAGKNFALVPQAADGLAFG